jgi:hypothetical protein
MSPMLPEDISPVEVVPLVARGEVIREGGQFSLEHVPVEDSFAWVVAAGDTEHHSIACFMCCERALVDWCLRRFDASSAGMFGRTESALSGGSSRRSVWADGIASFCRAFWRNVLSPLKRAVGVIT